MGTYVNPGNKAFSRLLGKNYVDKTKLIEAMNERVGGAESLVCVSRPRRFGKSYAAKMLTAYYDCSCDSHSLFENKAISTADSYEDHLNRYNVICLDISGFVSEVKKLDESLKSVPAKIGQALWKDLLESGFKPEDGDTLNDFLNHIVSQPGGKAFIFIIDEWDAMIREAKDDDKAQEAYLNLLRGWFKNTNFTPKVVAAAYMTGILPIKKDGSQSAISEFDESSMLDTLEFAEFVGFTENEVLERCRGGSVAFEEIKAWYDGYDLPDVGPVYNPYSVMKALKSGRCRSYWRKTSAAESLMNYINMDFEGLQEIVARLIAGEKITVNVDSFQNDFESFESGDDVLTLLIHLGYLTYHEADQTVEIPNEEVRIEFRQFLSQRRINNGWISLIKRSQKLLDDTIGGRTEAVEAALDEIRAEQYAPQFYNNEQALRAIIKYAYLAAVGQYVKIEEMPSGKGIADVVFIPAQFARLPAMVVELKWNKTAGGAISQIKEKKYAANLKPYAGNILLVGINYDDETGKHSCLIEKA
ncbi:MAG: AAA family ATPase [Lachnospiraceae bacterium]|nr:AAA family ATPase [Lachnospiraceae bacterium]